MFAARTQGVQIDVTQPTDPSGSIIKRTEPNAFVTVFDPSNPGTPVFNAKVFLEETELANNAGATVEWDFDGFEGGYGSDRFNNTEAQRNSNLRNFDTNTLFSGFNSIGSVTEDTSGTSFIGKNNNAATIAAGDPVDPVSGEFYLDEPADLSIRSLGFPLEISRYYTNQMIYDGPFGYGWAWSHSDGLLFETNSSTNEDAVIFYDSQRRALRIEDNSGVFTEPPGSTFKLKELPDAPDSGSEQLADGRDVKYRVEYFNGLVIKFDVDGRLLQKQDASGNTLTFYYDANNERIIRFEDAIGRAITLDYNDSGKVARVTDFLGRGVEYEYDGADLIAFIDLEGNRYKYEYINDTNGADAIAVNELLRHNMTRQILPSGDALTLHYYVNDTVSHHVNDTGEVFHFQYSPLNRYAETWNEKGFYRKLYWDVMGNVIRVDSRDRSIEVRQFDNNHNMIAQVDGNGNRTHLPVR